MNGALTQAESESILEGLSSLDAEVRRLSAEQLLQFPLEEALPRLMNSLGDSDWRVRKASVERLVFCREVQAVAQSLILALGDGENSGRRNAAFEALVGLGREASPYLVNAIASSDVDVRKLVVDALAAIGDRESCSPLVEALSDEDPNVRAAVAEALGVVGSSAQSENLLDVAASESEEKIVRFSALYALSRLKADVTASELSDTLASSLLRPAAFELLGHSQDEAARVVLLKGMSEPKRASREAAMGALLQCVANEDPDGAAALCVDLKEAAASDETILPFVCERLAEADLPRRTLCIQFLGLLEDPRCVVPILVAGRDEALTELADATLECLGQSLASALSTEWDSLDFDLRVRSCVFLGRVGGEQAEALLCNSITSSDSELRCAAAMALGEGGYVGQLPGLLRCLETAAESDPSDIEDEVPRLVSAIAALAERAEASDASASAQIIEMLTSRLGGASVPVRLAIAKVLARVGREQDQDVIGYLLKDASPQVRRSAVQAMARFGFDVARDSLRLALGDESGVVRIAAAQVIGDSGEPAAKEDLLRLLNDPDPAVVAVSVRALGHLCAGLPDEGHDVFDQIAPTLEAVPVVAIAGVEALLMMGGDGAVRLAQNVLAHPEAELVRAAISVLGAHGAPEDLIGAASLISHPDWSVRAEIVETLGRRFVQKGLPALLGRLEVEQDPFVRDAILLAIQKLEE